MPATPQKIDVWSVEGQFLHLIYSPKGAIEGVLIDSDGAPAQFVCDARDPAVSAGLADLQPGQAVVLEGTLQEPSPRGEPPHEVYRLERMVSVDGKPAAPRHHLAAVAGTVVRLNYAKHGEPNGVVLDTGDFIHTKPEGFQRLALKVGDKVRAEGDTRPLATGGGQVVQAHSVNGKPMGPAHGG